MKNFDTDKIIDKVKSNMEKHSHFPYYRIGIVVYNLEDIVNEWIRPDYRDDAILILKTYYDIIKSKDKLFDPHLVQLCVHSDKKHGNIVCLGLDKISDILLESIGLKSETFGLL